jgi:hypothetical protein
MARGKTIPKEVRVAICRAYRDSPGLFKQVYRSHGISRAAAYFIVRGGEDFDPTPRGGARVGSVTEEHVQKWLEIISENPSYTLEEVIRDGVVLGCPSVAQSTLCRYFKGRMISYKVG